LYPAKALHILFRLAASSLLDGILDVFCLTDGGRFFKLYFRKIINICCSFIPFFSKQYKMYVEHDFDGSIFLLPVLSRCFRMIQRHGIAE